MRYAGSCLLYTSETGVYGSVKSYMKGIEAEVALAQEVNTGDAEIIRCV